MNRSRGLKAAALRRALLKTAHSSSFLWTATAESVTHSQQLGSVADIYPSCGTCSPHALKKQFFPVIFTKYCVFSICSATCRTDDSRHRVQPWELLAIFHNGWGSQGCTVIKPKSSSCKNNLLNFIQKKACKNTATLRSFWFKLYKN